MWRNNIFVLCLILAATTAASGQQAETFRCKGKVVDALGRGVAGAQVAGFWGYLKGYQLSIGKTTTDEKGNFELNVQAMGKRHIRVAARKPGFALGWFRVTEYVTELDFVIVLQKPAELAGRVTDENEIPIPDAEVWASLTDKAVLSNISVTLSEPREWLTAKTDAHGRFSFRNLPPQSTAQLTASAPNRGTIRGGKFAAGRNNAHIVLPKAATVTGVVVDASTGRGVEGVPLVLIPDRKAKEDRRLCSPWGDPKSGEDGRFRLERVVPGSYHLSTRQVGVLSTPHPWVGKPILVNARAGAGNKEVTFRVSKGSIVEVEVMDAVTSQQLSEAAGTIIQVWPDRSGTRTIFMTDDNGIARIRRMAGQCVIGSVGKHGYKLLREGPALGKTAKGGIERHQIDLIPYPILQGQAVDPAGQPLAGAIVITGTFRAFVDRTDAVGEFALRYAPVSRKVVNRSRSLVLIRHEQRNLAAAVPAKDFTRKRRVVLKLAMSLVGHVKDQRGRPIPATRVRLMYLTPKGKGGFPGPGGYVGRDILTDSQGRYEFTVLPSLPQGYRYDARFQTLDGVSFGSVRMREHLKLSNGPGGQMNAEPVVIKQAK